MRLAVIDMGTNTFHLILVDVQEEGFKIFYRERKAVKIGKDGINNGMITDAAQQRAIDALVEFKELIEQHDIFEVHATATSAIRSAKNGKDLLKQIQQATGIKVRIISGQEEAEYIYYGVQKALEIGTEKHLIMDIGGGSIEFIIGSGKEISWLRSFEIGGQRMLDKFHRNDPIQPDEIAQLREYLNSNLVELLEACQIHQPRTMIGSSGTFDTLSDIYCNSKGITASKDQTEFPFDINQFDEIYDRIVGADRESRIAIPGMIEMRVELIVVAMILLKYVIDNCGIEDIRISSYALKEGVLLKTIDSIEGTDGLNQMIG